MAIIKCSTCGSEISDFATFCPNCGATIEKAEPVPATPVEVHAPISQDAPYATPAGQYTPPAYQPPVQPTPAPYATPVYKQAPSESSADPSANGKAIASLILGICGTIAWLLPLVGYPVTIVGLVLGIKGLKSEKRGMALAGLILSAVSLAACMINSCAGAIMALANY